MAKEPKITVSDTDPGESDVDNDSEIFISLRNSREKVNAALAANQKLPATERAALLARVAAIDAKHELIEVDFHGQPHRGGYNWSGTVVPLSS